MAVKNYKQGDSRWRSNTYAGNTMAGAGCGPTACANIIGDVKSNITPVDTAKWLTNHGYAIYRNGTSWYGIAACIDAYGLDCTQLNSSNQYGKTNTKYEVEWKQKMATNEYYGILLMGKGNFTKGGHYITIVKVDSSKGYYVHDPATSARDGWHPWSHFNGDVKVFYLIKKKPSSIKVLHSDSSSSSDDKRMIIKSGQVHANNFCDAKLAVDGISGPETNKAKVKVLQRAMNLDYSAGLEEDCSFGSLSKAALKGHFVKKNEEQYMVTACEILLMLNGYNPNGVECPGQFGNGLEKAVNEFKKDKGLEQNGICDEATFLALIS